MATETLVRITVHGPKGFAEVVASTAKKAEDELAKLTLTSHIGEPIAYSGDVDRPTQAGAAQLGAVQQVAVPQEPEPEVAPVTFEEMYEAATKLVDTDSMNGVQAMQEFLTKLEAINDDGMPHVKSLREEQWGEAKAFFEDKAAELAKAKDQVASVL